MSRGHHGPTGYSVRRLVSPIIKSWKMVEAKRVFAVLVDLVAAFSKSDMGQSPSLATAPRWEASGTPCSEVDALGNFTKRFHKVGRTTKVVDALGRETSQ